MYQANMARCWSVRDSRQIHGVSKSILQKRSQHCGGWASEGCERVAWLVDMLFCASGM